MLSIYYIRMYVCTYVHILTYSVPTKYDKKILISKMDQTYKIRGKNNSFHPQCEPPSIKAMAAVMSYRISLAYSAKTYHNSGSIEDEFFFRFPIKFDPLISRTIISNNRANIKGTYIHTCIANNTQVHVNDQQG